MSNFDTAFFERMRDWLDSEANWFGMHEDNTVEQLSQAFEAAETPPKPDEPQGLGAVVEDIHGRRYQRVDRDPAPWLRSDIAPDAAYDWRDYDQINAVRVLSPGVEVDQ